MQSFAPRAGSKLCQISASGKRKNAREGERHDNLEPADSFCHQDVKNDKLELTSTDARGAVGNNRNVSLLCVHAKEVSAIPILGKTKTTNVDLRLFWATFFHLIERRAPPGVGNEIANLESWNSPEDFEMGR